MKKPLYLETNLKIRLPNNHFIEVNFSVKETIKSLFQILDQILLNTNYYLFIPPFVNKKIKREDY